MTFGGTNEPCAYVTLMSIGRLGIEENKKHSNAIMNELEKLLEITPSRVCLFYLLIYKQVLNNLRNLVFTCFLRFTFTFKTQNRLKLAITRPLSLKFLNRIQIYKLLNKICFKKR